MLNDGKPTTERLYAWLSVMPPENVEGIVALQTEQGQVLPMVATDRQTASWMKPYAEMIARESGSTPYLVVFHRGETLEIN